MSKKDSKVIEAATTDETAAEEAAFRTTRFAKLFDEAMADYKPAKPYPFDADPDNIVYISRPDTTERALALATIVDDRGNFDVEGLKPMLEQLCGDRAFPYVWRVVRDAPIEVTIALVMDIQNWFYGDAAKGTADLVGGFAGLIQLIEEHGESIEWDLHSELNLDLLAFFRGEQPWPKLYRLLRKLPQGSRYKSALAENMELAKVLLELEEAEQEEDWVNELLADEDDEPQEEELSPTSAVGHTQEVELLMKITDWLQTVNSTLVGVNSAKGKRPRVRPHPRPVSAIQVLRREREKAAVRDVLSDAGIDP
ncbi:tail assembly chaperone [Gordonia phage SpeedDemon]|uniref:Tail assembly chaperone n=1 Tax=Gordonia phage Bantam TaxID=1887641 RepID=A0A1B3AY91_9CAUD|nr:tail assembly chaperone [Gordonia phage Bantam]AOE43717.1 tail assembly chaperone [Gordonia phage Bantam]QNL30480.1 tail assembly chaperone [Gordonia phage SpeedDemon]